MYERFSMYRFGIDYPNTWSIKFDPKSRRAEGYVMFKSPMNDKVYLTWGILESIGKKYDSLEAQAEASLARIRDGRGVRKLELIETKKMEVNGHSAIFNHFMVDTAIRLLMVKRKEIWSIHLHCKETERFFIVYQSTPDTSRSQEQSAIFTRMKESFACH